MTVLEEVTLLCAEVDAQAADLDVDLTVPDLLLAVRAISHYPPSARRAAARRTLRLMQATRS